MLQLQLELPLGSVVQVLEHLAYGMSLQELVRKLHSRFVGLPTILKSKFTLEIALIWSVSMEMMIAVALNPKFP